MAKGPQDKFDENLARKLAKVGLSFSLRLLVFVGKPFYLVIITPFIVLFYVLRITGQVSKPILRVLTVRKQSHKLSESGVIFSSKWFATKVLISTLWIRFGYFFRLFEKAHKDSKKTYYGIYWKIQVFFLAVGKLFGKLLIYSKTRVAQIKFKEKISVSFLSLRIKRLYILSLIPQIKIPKISKLKFLTYFFVFSFLTGFVGAVFFWILILKDLPSPQDLTKRSLPVSTKIYDRNGIPLYTIFKNQNRTPVALKDIPTHIRSATIAAEDAEFYSHPGFSIKGIARAIIKNLKEGEVTGGSTITQQLVKNALLTPEKTVRRKLKEIVLSVKVELTFSKDQILEMYLNEVAYGRTAYGIQEASLMYFGKEVDKLTLGEAALLAGLPQSPTRYSPFGSHPENAISRQKEVLRRMQDNGFITEEQRKRGEEEQMVFVQDKIPIKAPHFVFYVREELEKKYGENVVEQGGLEVITTLDYKVQELAEEVVKKEIEKLQKLNATNAAVVVLKPTTGEILAMVGSKDFFDTDASGNVNVAIRPRQPGSSIKVINYAYALSNGMTPSTIIPDTPVTFLVDGQPPYTPKNYEGGFRGNLTLRSALAESRNVPAVRVLSKYGVENMLQMGQKMGVTTWSDPSKYGLSLTLGGGEVKLLDLARVYATLANYGRRPELVSTLKVTNYQAKVLEEFSCEKDKKEKTAEASASDSASKDLEDSLELCPGEQVLDPRVAFILTDILRDNFARAPSFGSNSLLVIPNHTEVAVKTGTSNDLRDNLAIGYNQNYVVATWVGNNDNSPMSRIASGVTGATPIFHNIMSALVAEQGNHDWETPEGLVKLPVCQLLGTLACAGCPTKMEWFLQENRPEIACRPEWFQPSEQVSSQEDGETNGDLIRGGQDLNNQYFEVLLDEQERIKKKKPHPGD